jgi:hypothetical protein
MMKPIYLQIFSFHHPVVSLQGLTTFYFLFSLNTSNKKPSPSVRWGRVSAIAKYFKAWSADDQRFAIVRLLFVCNGFFRERGNF